MNLSQALTLAKSSRTSHRMRALAHQDIPKEFLAEMFEVESSINVKRLLIFHPNFPAEKLTHALLKNVVSIQGTEDLSLEYQVRKTEENDYTVTLLESMLNSSVEIPDTIPSNVSDAIYEAMFTLNESSDVFLSRISHQYHILTTLERRGFSRSLSEPMFDRLIDLAISDFEDGDITLRKFFTHPYFSEEHLDRIITSGNYSYHDALSCLKQHNPRISVEKVAEAIEHTIVNMPRTVEYTAPITWLLTGDDNKNMVENKHKFQDDFTGLLDIIREANKKRQSSLVVSKYRMISSLSSTFKIQQDLNLYDYAVEHISGFQANDLGSITKLVTFITDDLGLTLLE